MIKEYTTIFSFDSLEIHQIQESLSSDSSDLNLEQLTPLELFDPFEWVSIAKSIIEHIEAFSKDLFNNNENFIISKDPESFKALLTMLQENEVSSLDDFKVFASQIIFNMSLNCFFLRGESSDRSEIQFMFECLLL